MPDNEAKSVLIIEDEAEIRKFVRRLLELEGYHILETDNADDGLRMIKETRRLSLVLLDLKLPGSDGWLVLEEMKKDTKLSKIPVVVFSASAAESQREKALKMGATGYLVKPLSVASLKQAAATTTTGKR